MTRISRKPGRALLAGTVLVVVVAGIAQAGVYGTNTGAAAAYGPGGTAVKVYGGEGYQRLHSATQKSGGAIIHPFQSSSGSAEFAAVGTYKGKGTNVPGAKSNCVATTGSDWVVYTDGRENGVYTCVTHGGTSYANTNTSWHQIEMARKTGCGTTATRWCTLDETVRTVASLICGG